jgi:hypothetical protein
MDRTAEPGAREVVAGVINDGSAAAVASAAVRIARELHSGVRFVQVLPDSLTGDARAEVESALFSTALRALRGGPRVQATFEAPSGDPARVLVARSRTALRLIVGADQPHLDGDGAVAAYCVAHAACAVDVVPLAGAVPSTTGVTVMGTTPDHP